MPPVVGTNSVQGIEAIEEGIFRPHYRHRPIELMVADGKNAIDRSSQRAIPDMTLFSRTSLSDSLAGQQTKMH